MNDPIQQAAAAMVQLLDSKPTVNELLFGIVCINTDLYEGVEPL